MRLSLVGRAMAGLVVVIGIALAATPAHAVKEFRDEFEARYVKRNSRKRPDVSLARAVDQAKCTVCHQGEDKHRLNAYGSQVAQLVNKQDKGNRAKIQAALERAATISSDPFTPKSPTFGALIRKGQLPVSPEPPPQ